MSVKRKVSKGVLKAKMLEYFREVESTGEELIVTDNNRPVLKIVAIEQRKKSVQEVFSKYQGKLKTKEDLTKSTESEWEDI